MLEVEVLDVKVLEVLVLLEDVLGRLVEVLEAFVPNVLVLDLKCWTWKCRMCSYLEVMVMQIIRLAGSWLSRMPYQKRNL